MNNNLLQIKIKQRLNKLASLDYDNIECWQIAEAFNKAQIEWTRRQIRGVNIKKEGSEQSQGIVDDLQRLIKQDTLNMTDKVTYYQSETLPEDYLQFIRTDVFAKQECCPERRVIVYPVEEADISIILDNDNKKPSFEWSESVSTLMNNTLKVYTNDEFDVTECHLVYYRKPQPVQFTGCIDITTGFPFAQDQECEFNDDVAEIIVDQAVAILAGDIEAVNQYQRESQAVQQNS
jgi:hypothetical protein